LARYNKVKINTMKVQQLLLFTSNMFVVSPSQSLRGGNMIVLNKAADRIDGGILSPNVVLIAV